MLYYQFVILRREFVMENKAEKAVVKGEKREMLKNAPEIFPGARAKMLKIPVFLIIPIIYILIGRLLNIWHPTWLMFLYIPMYYQICIAVGTKTKRGFLLNLPVVFIIATAYITVGIFFNMWDSAWFLFLLIPVYYWVVAFIKE